MGGAGPEHFPKKWTPVFRKENATKRESRPFADSTEAESGLRGAAGGRRSW
jgi:hypothetical protein